MLEISIIIPVYNAESYIERCLQSIISSSAPEGSYEIIAVDDSSSDRSLEVLQKMEEQIPQLHVYHRRKAGPASVICVRYKSFICSDLSPACIYAPSNKYPFGAFVSSTVSVPSGRTALPSCI